LLLHSQRHEKVGRKRRHSWPRSVAFLLPLSVVEVHPFG
jgi:hypothetical protein